MCYFNPNHKVFLNLTKLTLYDEGLVHLLLVRHSGRCSEILGIVMCVILGSNLQSTYSVILVRKCFGSSRTGI